MARDQRLVIGVDGGGSGCRVAIALPDGPVLARAEAGPANVSSDPEGSLRNIREALEAAAKNMQSADDLWNGTAHFGLAGVQTSAQADLVRNAFPFRGGCRVTEDGPTQLAGAMGDRDGVLLAVGTGSFAALARGGTTRFLGGWGPILGDDASGAWLGRALLRRVLLAEDGLVAHSPLTQAVLHEFDADPFAIVAFGGRASAADFATFGRRVAETAQTGDSAAQALMREGATYLIGCLDLLGSEGDECVVLSGGIGPHYAPYLAPTYRQKLQSPHGDALDGALRLARSILSGNG